MSEKNPFLKLSILVTELWNEYKGLRYANSKKQKERILVKLKKMVQEIKDVDFEEEFKFIQEFKIDRGK